MDMPNRELTIKELIELYAPCDEARMIMLSRLDKELDRLNETIRVYDEELFRQRDLVNSYRAVLADTQAKESGRI